MCKIMVLTAIQNSKLALSFMAEMAPLMSVGNSHGIGYTAVDSNGNMATERWHVNSMFGDYDSIMTAKLSKRLQSYKARLPTGSLNVNYNNAIEETFDIDGMRSVTMHTRYATCGREFKNTHPFVYDDTSLIHNGIIRNADKLNVNKISTCDSESALQTYLASNVPASLQNIQPWIDQLEGYWAFGIIGKKINNTRTLDVVKGEASLVYSEIEGLGFVFTTSGADIISVCKKLELTYTTPAIVSSNSAYRYDAVTGNLLDSIDYTQSTLNYVAPVVTTYVPPQREFFSRSYMDEYMAGVDDMESFAKYHSYKKWIEKINKTVRDDAGKIVADRLAIYLNKPTITMEDKLEFYDECYETFYANIYLDSPENVKVALIQASKTKGFNSIIELLKNSMVQVGS